MNSVGVDIIQTSLYCTISSIIILKKLKLIAEINNEKLSSKNCNNRFSYFCSST